MPRNSICIKMGKRLSFHVLKWCCTRSHPPPSPHPPTHIHTHKHQVWDNYHKKEDLDSVRPHIYDLFKKKVALKFQLKSNLLKAKADFSPQRTQVLDTRWMRIPTCQTTLTLRVSIRPAINLTCHNTCILYIYIQAVADLSKSQFTTTLNLQVPCKTNRTSENNIWSFNFPSLLRAGWKALLKSVSLFEKSAVTTCTSYGHKSSAKAAPRQYGCLHHFRVFRTVMAWVRNLDLYLYSGRWCMVYPVNNSYDASLWRRYQLVVLQDINTETAP